MGNVIEILSDIPERHMLWHMPESLRKKYPLRPFNIRRTKYNEWFIFRNGEKFKKDPIEEDDIDNQIANIKDIIRIQRLVKSQDIEVIKDMDNGIITINLKKHENKITENSKKKILNCNVHKTRQSKLLLVRT